LHFPIVKLNKPAPFARLEFDTTGQVITRFIDAVRKNPDGAWAFVSKIYSAQLDLNELKEILDEGVKPLKMATYVNRAKNCLTRSVYVNDTSQKVRKLLHIHMVKDNGKWKVFGVEQDECTRI